VTHCGKVELTVTPVNKVSYGKKVRASAFVSPKILARAGNVVDAVKYFLTSNLITMQNLVAVRAHVRYQRFWGHQDPAPLN